MNAPRYIRLLGTLSAVILAGCKGPSSPEVELETMTRRISTEFSEVPRISTADLASWMADPTRQPPQLIDVREPAEYAVSHLPGAIRVAPDATAEQVTSRVDPARPIVVYCSVGYRSSILAKRLVAAGTKQTMNLEGSIFKWANEDRPLVRDGGPTRSVHPYNGTFGRMLREDLRAYH